MSLRALQDWQVHVRMPGFSLLKGSVRVSGFRVRVSKIKQLGIRDQGFLFVLFQGSCDVKGSFL